MSQLYDTTSSTLISDCVESCEAKQSTVAVENISLDGTYYRQIIGSPQITYNIKCYVDRAGKAALEAAEAGGDVLSCAVHHGTYTGRVKTQSCDDGWGLAWFEAAITLAKEVTA